MLYIKKNPEVMEELMEDMSSVTSDDVVGLAQEINMECAMLTFEVNHSVLESYEASLEMSSDSFADAKNNIASGNVEDAEFREAGKDDAKSAADNKVNEKAKKGILERVKTALQSIWNKIKELFQRFVNWIVSKIESTDKFLEKYKDKKLGSVKIESHDFAEVFKRVRTVNDQGKKLFDIAKKGLDEILAKGKKAIASDELKAALVDSHDEVEEYCKHLKSSWITSARIVAGDQDNFPSVIKAGLLGEKKEREWKGEELIKILQDNKDIRKTLEKLNFSTLDNIKLLNNYIKNCSAIQSIGFSYNHIANFIIYAANKSAAMMSQTVLVAQSTIMELRAAINKCAKGETAEAK